MEHIKLIGTALFFCCILCTGCVGSSSLKDPSSPFREVTLQYVNDRARKVEVVGSFNDWMSTPLTRTGGGKWRMQVRLLRGAYQYLFVVDGKNVADPKSNAKIPDGFGGMNSLIIVD